MKNLLYLFGLFISLASFGQNTKTLFEQDLDFVYEQLQKTPSYKTQKANQKRLQETYQAIKSEYQGKDPDKFETYFKLVELLEVLNDRHNYIIGNTKSFPQDSLSSESFVARLRANSDYQYPKVTMDLDSLETALSNKKTEDVEGIYYYYHDLFKIGVFKNASGMYQGVVLDTKIVSWEVGETILYAKPLQGNRFQIYGGAFVNKLLYSTVDYLSEGSFKKFEIFKKGHEPIHYHAPKMEGNFHFEEKNPSFSYMLVKSFNMSVQNESKGFLKEVSDKLTTENLIVDLRNNSGGADKVSKPFYKLFKKYKGNIYVLINYNTVSNGERFALQLKKLKNVMLLGDDTQGMLTYVLNFPTEYETPSGRFLIHFTDRKFQWKKYRDYESIGIQPEVYLDHTTDWIEYIIEQYDK